MDGVQWTCLGPWCPIIGINGHGAPSSEKKIFFFISLPPKMKMSPFKYYFFIFHFTIKNVLIDRGSPSNMPVDMSIVPRPHVHGAPSSGHHGHFLDFFKIDF